MAIYLDSAASVPLHPRVAALAARLAQLPPGNAASSHSGGRGARMLLEDARERVARRLGALVEEIVWTSGATEANNLALLGWMRAQPRGSHLLVGSTEHPSVREPALALSEEGYELEWIPVDRSGVIDLEWLSAHLRPSTRLVSVQAVNNEVGTCQPLDGLRALKGAAWKLHVDAAQCAWVGLPALDGIDFLSLSGHKWGAPVGCGCLFLRQGLRLRPLLLGGGQEDGRRAGTSNSVAAALLAEALELPLSDLRPLRDRLEAGVSAIEGAQLLAASACRSPHISAWTFAGVAAEPLLVRLDLADIAASSGSACASHSLEPSATLLAMGCPPEQARGLLRFSLGWHSTVEEIETVLAVLPAAVGACRRLSACL